MDSGVCVECGFCSRSAEANALLAVAGASRCHVELLVPWPGGEPGPAPGFNHLLLRAP